MPLLPDSYLRLLPDIERRMLEDAANASVEWDWGQDKISWWIHECHLENLSEGSGQISPDEDRSCRAFTNLIKVDPRDLAIVRGHIGRRRTWGEHALSLIITNALSTTPEFAAALAAAKPARSTPAGPFDTRKKTLELLPTVRKLGAALATARGIIVREDQLVNLYLKTQALIFSMANPGENTDSHLRLAGLINIEQADAEAIVAVLTEAGLDKHRTAGVLADIVIAALREDPRFTQGLIWSQAEKKAAASDEEE